MGPLLNSNTILIARRQHLGPDYGATDEQLWPRPVWRGDLSPRTVLARSPVLTGGVAPRVAHGCLSLLIQVTGTSFEVRRQS